MFSPVRLAGHHTRYHMRTYVLCFNILSHAMSCFCALTRSSHKENVVLFILGEVERDRDVIGMDGWVKRGRLRVSNGWGDMLSRVRTCVGIVV